MWVADDNDAFYTCKADVLAYYRVSKRLDVVIQDLQQQERDLEEARRKAKNGRN